MCTQLLWCNVWFDCVIAAPVCTTRQYESAGRIHIRGNDMYNACTCVLAGKGKLAWVQAVFI